MPSFTLPGSVDELFHAEVRRQRTAQLKELRISQPRSELANTYLTEALLCFLNSQDLGCILLCAIAVEIQLRESLAKMGLPLRRELRKLNFVELLEWSEQTALLPPEAARAADRVRERRNDVAHAYDFWRVVRRYAKRREAKHEADAFFEATKRNVENLLQRPIDWSAHPPPRDELAVLFALGPFAFETLVEAMKVFGAVLLREEPHI